jgi:hypothetical protein
MELLRRLFRRGSSGHASSALSSRDQMIAQVTAMHRAWYPAHNLGKEAPEAAVFHWIQKLQASSLQVHEIVLLLADNKSRNVLLGKTWP